MNNTLEFLKTEIKNGEIFNSLSNKADYLEIFSEKHGGGCYI